MDDVEFLHQQAFANARNINLQSTFVFIDNLNSRKQGVIESSNPILAGALVELIKSSREYLFTAKLQPHRKVTGQLTEQVGSFHNVFAVTCGNDSFLLPHGVHKLSYKMVGETFSGSIFEIESGLESMPAYYRAVWKIDPTYGRPVNYMVGTPFKVEDSLRAAGYIDVVIDGIEVGFFDYGYRDDVYLFVEACAETDLAIFEKIIDAVIYSFSLISGSLVRDEVFILSFSSKSFEDVIGFKYLRQLDSNNSSLELIDPFTHEKWAGLSERFWFPNAVFSVIVNQCFSDKTGLRALKIIAQARGLPPEIQLASYFVALESIKGIILAKNIEKTRSFVDREIATHTIAKCKKEVLALPDEAFLSRERVLRKLEQLDDIGNNESFIKAFELVGFDLTKGDRSVISKRNEFLHGRFEFNDQRVWDEITELQEFTVRAHFLVCVLFLKFAGYVGPVKNLNKLADLTTGRNMLNEPLFTDV